jgi:hypothetical protein
MYGPWKQLAAQIHAPLKLLEVEPFVEALPARHVASPSTLATVWLWLSSATAVSRFTLPEPSTEAEPVTSPQIHSVLAVVQAAADVADVALPAKQGDAMQVVAQTFGAVTQQLAPTQVAAQTIPDEYKTGDLTQVEPQIHLNVTSFEVPTACPIAISLALTVTPELRQ